MKTQIHEEIEPQIGNYQVEQIRLRARNAFVAIAVFVLIVSTLVIIRYFTTSDLIADGKFYRQHLLSYEMEPFWKELAKIDEEEKKTQIIEEGQHKISREELGRMGWTMLHMMTGGFPEEITPVLRQKFNTFLILFGQFYPCKLCSSHFLPLIKQVGPFTGSSRNELMIYLCKIHNRVNKRLGKKQHDCEGVPKQWNTCGCMAEL